MTKTIALFALALAGCAGPEPLLQSGESIHVVGFGAEHQDAICAAVAEWGHAFPALRPTLATTVGDWTMRPEQLRGSTSGLTSPYRRAIAIDVGRARDVQTVATHEIGHAVGMHDESLIRGRCLSADAVAAVCAARPELCDGRERPTCE